MEKTVFPSNLKALSNRMEFDRLLVGDSQGYQFLFCLVNDKLVYMIYFNSCTRPYAQKLDRISGETQIQPNRLFAITTARCVAYCRRQWEALHRAYIEGFSRRNAFWRLDSEFRVVLQIQSLWPKIGKIWTLDLESSINFDSKSRVVHQS